MASSAFHVQVISRRLRPLDRSVPIATAVLDAGVDSLQLRDEVPSMTAMIQALNLTPAWNRDRIVVHGEPRVAGAYGIQWLHLGASWLEQTPPFARFTRVGISVHSLWEAVEAESLGADYVSFGHVFPTGSHPGMPGRDVAALAEIVERLEIPVLAVGGIDHANVNRVLATGCAGIAVLSAIGDQADPARAARTLIDIVRASNARPKRPLPPMPVRSGML